VVIFKHDRKKRFIEPTFSIVEQYWIDIENFNKETHSMYSKLKLQVEEILITLNRKLSEN